MLGFWLEDDVVLCGTSDQLKVLLNDAGVIATSPFVEVERATFLEDEQLIEDAAEVASEMLHNQSARSSYLQRVKRRVAVMASLREDEQSPETKDDDDLSHLLAILESEADSNIWFTLWEDGFRRPSWRRRLSDVARWRIMSSGLGDYEYQILRAIRYVVARGEDDLFRWWLDNRDSAQPSWILIWSLTNISPEKYPAEKLIESLTLAFEKEAFGDSNGLCCNLGTKSIKK